MNIWGGKGKQTSNSRDENKLSFSKINISACGKIDLSVNVMIWQLDNNHTLNIIYIHMEICHHSFNTGLLNKAEHLIQVQLLLVGIIK